MGQTLAFYPLPPAVLRTCPSLTLSPQTNETTGNLTLLQYNKYQIAFSHLLRELENHYSTVKRLDGPVLSPWNIPQMTPYHLIFETMVFSLDSHLWQLGFILSGISCFIVPFITFEIAPYPEICSAPILSVVSGRTMSLLAGWVGPSLAGVGAISSEFSPL